MNTKSCDILRARAQHGHYLVLYIIIIVNITVIIVASKMHCLALPRCFLQPDKAGWRASRYTTCSRRVVDPSDAGPSIRE